MTDDITNKASNLILEIIFVAIFFAVMLLALVLIFAGLTQAYLNANNVGLTATNTITNETGYANNSGYTLLYSTDYGFTSPSITKLFNKTSGKVVELANVSVSNSGLVTNASVVVWSNLSISYTYTYNTNLSIVNQGNAIQNNVLGMVYNFFALMPTIGTIFAVCILIAGIVILVLYVRRMKETGTESSFSG